MTSNPNKRALQSVSFDSDGGVQINYYTPATDVTTVGAVHLHTLLVPSGFDYDDEIRAIEEAADYLIGDVLDDWERLPKLRDGGRDPDEDTPGPG